MIVGEKIILRYPKIHDAEWLFENLKKLEDISFYDLLKSEWRYK